MTKKMVEVKRMTFAEASEKLSGIVGDRYHSIKFELNRHEDGLFSNGRKCEAVCSLYLEGSTYVAATDWEGAFQKLERLQSEAAPDPMEIAPTGDPTECAETTDYEPDH